MLLKPGHKKETHVNVTGSVTLPLTEAVLPSSGWAEGHRRVSQGQRSHLEHITSHYNRSLERTGLCRFIQPIGGGHDTGLEKPLPEDRVCLCVRISCFAERGCQRFSAEIQPPPGVLTRDAAFRFEKRDGRFATRRDLRGSRRKERLWPGSDAARAAAITLHGC